MTILSGEMEPQTTIFKREIQFDEVSGLLIVVITIQTTRGQCDFIFK